MDPNEALGLSPERHVLAARRLRATGDVPSDPSDALTRRMATWVSASVAVFTQIFAIALIFAWISLKAMLEVTLCAGSCVLVCAILLGALSVRRALRRA
jgi:acid phosphatase family membrane protein YuiD